MHYILRAEQQPDLTIPWPVVVSEDGAIISGRPDAYALIGFQVGMRMKIARTFEQAMKDTGWVKGKFPVYRYAFDDGLFVVLEKIELVTVITKEVLGLYP